MVELFEQDIVRTDRQSSKGNQLKWNKNGVWYKADYTGYEGLAEVVISHLLEKSSLKRSEFVIYEPERIGYKHRSFNGVKSSNFVKPGWQIITIGRLFKTYMGRNLYEEMWKIPEACERVEYMVDQVERVTGLTEFGQYLAKLITIDALFLNEDRHLHNIAVLMDGNGGFSYCPVFDNGAALLSDTMMDYPMGQDIFELIREVKSKTFSSCFDEQLDVIEKKYGEAISFSFKKADVRDILNKVDIYGDEEKRRVEDILYEQMRRYSYLFE